MRDGDSPVEDRDTEPGRAARGAVPGGRPAILAPCLPDGPLRAALARRPACDEALAAACFDHGVRLARSGAGLPAWLAGAPRWARAAVAVGHASARRAMRENARIARDR